MSRSKLQGFRIRNYSGDIDACASFWFKGVQISFTSMGYSRGSFLNEIVVFDSDDNVLNTFQGTVEDALNWVIDNL